MVGRFIMLLAVAVSATAAELQLKIEPRWGNTPLAVPSAAHTSATGQAIRVTRLAALLADFQLLRRDGSVVRLDGQYGFIDAGTGRLTVDLTGVPAGDYAGLQVGIGVPVEANHGDPGRWPAGHPLNPLVNALHWSWQGGYVFFALEGYWRESNWAGASSGFSYHVATDARRMTVRFLAAFTVQATTEVSLALDVAKLFRERKINAADGTDSTHSAADDPLATALAGQIERSWFWLEAKAGGAALDDRRLDSSISKDGGHRPPLQKIGTPLAFTVPAGFPQPALPADNPLMEEGVELGRRLFFDRRLSSTGMQSCASCHEPPRAFSDRVALSLGAEGKPGVRNAMPLFNLAWHPAYAWDGTKKRIRDQVIAALTNPVEMNANLAEVVADLGEDPRVVADFKAAFGEATVTAERLGLALEQFCLTLVSADSKFDRALDGKEKLTEQEQQGFALFAMEYDPARGKRGADCFHCHGGSLFTDFVVRSNGLDLASADAGAQLATGQAADHGRFKTPSLRNVALTAPYMHDGRLTTLEQVVAHYDHGVQRAANLDPNLAKHPAAGMGLSAEDQAALVAFLKTLTDADFSRVRE